MRLDLSLISGFLHMSLTPGLALINGIPFGVGVSKNFRPLLVATCSSIKSLKVIYDFFCAQGFSSISDFYEYWDFINKSGIFSGFTLAGSSTNSAQLKYFGLGGVSPTLSDLGGLLCILSA